VKVQQNRTYFWAVTYNGTGTNFAIFSQGAAVIRLCLFDMDDPNADPAGGQESLCLELLHTSRASVQRCGYRSTRPSTTQGAQSSLLRPHLPAAEEPDYAVEASLTCRNAVERPVLTAIRSDMIRLLTTTTCGRSFDGLGEPIPALPHRPQIGRACKRRLPCVPAKYGVEKTASWVHIQDGKPWDPKIFDSKLRDGDNRLKPSLDHRGQRTTPCPGLYLLWDPLAVD
jgi:hypothetical protein